MTNTLLSDLTNAESDLSDLEAHLTTSENAEKKHLLQSISYHNDIEPYGLTEIISGVGSGKNFFINKLSAGMKKGEDDALEDVEKKTVLLITSRRAKADELRNDETVTMAASVDAWEYSFALNDIDDIDEYLASAREIARTVCEDDEWEAWGTAPTIHQPSTAWTSAGLEHYLKKHYNPMDSTTHLWNRFDLIVVDEVHSVVADASYQTAPFYVQAFVNEAYARYEAKESTCNVVIMTGTPGILKDYTFPKNSNRINKLDECINTKPKQVVFVTKAQAKNILHEKLIGGERVAYYFNHIGDMLGMANDLKETAIYERTVVSFSDKDRRVGLKDSAPSLYKRMVATENHIMIHQKLPEDIQLFLSTGKNKEGINIKDKDIKTLFVENHAEVDIVQIAGRIREGVDVLYIITDSTPHSGSRESRYEYRLSIQEGLLPAINRELEEAAKMDGVDLHRRTRGRKPVSEYPNVNEYITHIHGKFPYIRYDYFKDQFALYHQRKSSIRYYKEQQRMFTESLSSPEKLKKLADTWFPGVPVTVLTNIQQQVDEYLESNHWLNGERTMVGTDRKQILDDLNKITGEDSKQLGTLIKHYGYLLNKPGHKSQSPSTITKILDGDEGDVS